MTPAVGPPAPTSSDPWARILDALVPPIEERLAALGTRPDPGWVSAHLSIEGGPEGDVALPLHRLAARSGSPPDVFARRAAEGFPLPPGVREVRSVGAYLNVRIEEAVLAEETLAILRDRGRDYGGANPGRGSVCVEHTSANPTGPLHVGRIRNSLIGDTLARVLRASGHAVTTQYYVDDVGRQAAMVTWIWLKPPDTWPPEIRGPSGSTSPPDPSERGDRRLGRPYPLVSAYLKTHPEAAREVAEITEALESGRPPAQHRPIGTEILAGMLDTLERIGVRFDELVWESDFLRDGSVARVLDLLRAAPHAVRAENGALAIDAQGRDLPKESHQIIVQRANGTSLYVTRDIAYHLAKFARFPRVIDVLGQDHLLHARTLEVLLDEIGERRRPEFVLYQYLTAPDGGGMSTRKGTAIHLDTLLDEAAERARAEVRSRWPELPEPEVHRIAESLAAGAVRYHILRVASDKSVAFRWEDALSFEGRSGPFVQYAYARATSLLVRGEAMEPRPVQVSELGTPEEWQLLRVIARWPRTVAATARTGHVHAIAGYAHDLAEAFNRFYQTVPVLTAGELRTSRLGLVQAARTTLGSVLDLLGMPVLERM